MSTQHLEVSGPPGVITVFISSRGDGKEESDSLWAMRDGHRGLLIEGLVDAEFLETPDALFVLSDYQLWVTDGTRSGTVLLAQIEAGEFESVAHGPDGLYYTVYDDDLGYALLFRYANGTLEQLTGTTDLDGNPVTTAWPQVADVYTLDQADGVLYAFTADDCGTGTIFRWNADGSVDTFDASMVPYPYGYAFRLTEVPDLPLFGYFAFDTYGLAMLGEDSLEPLDFGDWEFDGELAWHDGALYIALEHYDSCGELEGQLFRFDGSTLAPVEGTAGGTIEAVWSTGGALLYAAWGAYGPDLYRIGAGGEVDQITGTDDFVFFVPMGERDGLLYFVTLSANLEQAFIARIGATGEPEVVLDLTGMHGTFGQLVFLGDLLVFSAYDFIAGQAFLVVANADGELTSFGNFEDMGQLVVEGDRVYFYGSDGTTEQMWVSDGTEAGTMPWQDYMPGPAVDWPREFFRFSTPPAGNIDAFGLVTINGTLALGRELLAEAFIDDWNGPLPAETPLQFQWFRDGDLIEGADAATYVVTADDVNHRLSVLVRFDDALGHPEVLLSAPSDLVDGLIATPRLNLAAASDTGLSDSDHITRLTKLKIVGTGTAGSTVHLLVDGSEVGTAKVSAAGTWAIAASALAEGEHVFTAYASKEGVDTTRVSAPLAVEVDTTAPERATLELRDPGSDDVIPGGAAIRTNAIRIDIHADEGSLVELFDGQTLLGTYRFENWTDDSYTFHDLDQGVHRIMARTTDVAGNRINSKVVAFTVDWTAPAMPEITGIAPASDSGEFDDDGITKVRTPVITGTGEAGSRIELSVDGNVVGSAAVKADGTFSIRTTRLDEGFQVIYAYAYDKAGNWSMSLEPLLLTVDTAAPTATVRLADPWLYESLGQKALTALNDLTLVVSTEYDVRVEILQNGSVIRSELSPTGFLFHDFTDLADGTYQWRIRTSDLAGNVSKDTVYTVTVDTTGPAAPTEFRLAAASDTGFSSADSYTRVKTPTLTGKAEAGARVDIYSNGSVVGSAIAKASGEWSVRLPTLDDANHVFWARAVDAAGNLGDFSSRITVTVDTAPPPKPTLSFWNTSGSITGGISNSASFMVGGVTEPGAFVELLKDGASMAAGFATFGGDFAFELAGLADGQYKIAVRVSDWAGNAVTSTSTMRVDTVAPAFTFTGLAPASDKGPSNTDGITNASNLYLVGTGEPGALVHVDFTTLTSGGPIFYLDPVKVAANGTWKVLAPGMTADAWGFRAYAEDAAGNRSTAETQRIDIVQSIALPELEIDVLGTAPAGYVTEGDNVVFSLTGWYAQVQLYDGRKLIASGTSDESGLWQWEASADTFTTGAHSFSVKVMDIFGNTATSVAVDLIADFGLLQPVIASVVAGDEEWVVTGYAEAGARIQAYLGSNAAGTAVTADGKGLWSVTIAPPGNADLRVEARDAAGHVASTGPTVLAVGAESGLQFPYSVVANLVGSRYSDHYIADFYLYIGGKLFFDGGANAGSKPWGPDQGDDVLVYGMHPEALTVRALAAKDPGLEGLAYRAGYRVLVEDGLNQLFLKNVEEVKLQSGAIIPLALHTGLIADDADYAAYAFGGVLADKFVATSHLSPEARAALTASGKGVLVDLGAGNDTATGSAGSDLFVLGAGTNKVDGGDGDDVLALVLADGAQSWSYSALDGSGSDADATAFSQGYAWKVTSGAEIDYLKNVETLRIVTWTDSDGDGFHDAAELVQLEEVSLVGVPT